MNPVDQVARRSSRVIVIAGYALLSLLATWPLVLHFDTHSPGTDSWAGRRIYFETPSHVWNLWWFRHAIVELHQSPFDCTHVFYPYGANLWFHPLAPVRGVIGIGLQSVFDLPATLNLLLLADLIAAGGFGYLAARRMGMHGAGAFVAGAIYVFAPGSFAHAYAGNFEQMSTAWMPAALWLFLCLLEPTSRRWRVSVGLVLVLVGAAYTCHYYFIFTAELLALAAVVYWRRVMGMAKLGAMTAAGTIVGISPIVWAFLASDGPRPDVSWSAEFDSYSGDLLSFLVPGFMNPLVSELLGPWHQRLIPTPYSLPQECTMYLGYSVIVLAVSGVVLRGAPDASIRLSAAVFLVFSLLALGAHLKVAGYNTGLPMPALLYSKLPLLQFARAPGRHIVVAMLGLSMLAGWGWQSIRSWRIRCILLALLPLEFASAPLPLFPVQSPEVYRRLRDTSGDFAVMEIPLGLRDGTLIMGDPDTRQLLGQTVHGRPIVGGMVGRVPTSTWRRFRAAPVIGTLLQSDDPASWASSLEYDRRTGPAFFAQSRIGVIVIHARAKDGPAQRYIEGVLVIARREMLPDGTQLLWLE